MAKYYFSDRYSSLLDAWEQEAYKGGYGADWLEEIGESVRIYAMDCENSGKRPTFCGLIQYLKILHDGVSQKDWSRQPAEEG